MIFADYNSVKSIFDEWRFGIPVTSETMTLPMFQLEMEHRSKWRSGVAMRRHLHWRKTVIYALHREYDQSHSWEDAVKRLEIM